MCKSKPFNYNLKLFVNDLYNAEKKNACFVFRNTVFSIVTVRGTIVGLEKDTTKRPKFTVCDGTSSIDCFYGDCPMSIPMVQIRGILESPAFDELKLGDTVELTGKLREYLPRRCIFITEMKKDSRNNTIHDIEYFDKVIEAYHKY